jgi:hypothetical protein
VASLSASNAHNAAVACQHCEAEITFAKPTSPPSQISLQCAKCGRRKIYAPSDVRVIRQPEQKKAR